MKGNGSRLAQSRFELICYWILTGNERKWASAGSKQILVDLLLNSNRKKRKLTSAGSEQILIDLLLNSNWKWKEIGLGWLRADFGWFAIKLKWEMKGNWPRLAQSRFWLICYSILLGSERKLASADWEQILVDLLSNSNREWKEIGLGWLRADFGWFAIQF